MFGEISSFHQLFLGDSDEEAIVEFVKQHKELYDKTNDKFRDKHRKERLSERLAASINLFVNTVKKWLETQRTRYGSLLRQSQNKLMRRTPKTDMFEGEFQYYMRSH